MLTPRLSTCGLGDTQNREGNVPEISDQEIIFWYELNNA
jgi:hypothetical protein